LHKVRTMSRSADADERATLKDALFEMNNDDLKSLGKLTGERRDLPTRKAELVDVVLRHVKGERLLAVWQDLDETEQAAIAEVVHSASSLFSPARFRAKYRRDPDWGTSGRTRESWKPQHSPLRFFFPVNRRMPLDLKERLKAFVPPPAPDQVGSVPQLPAAIGKEAVPLAVRESERAAQRELVSVLRLIDAGKVAVSAATGKASGTTLEALSAVLEGGDYYPPPAPGTKPTDEDAGPIRAFAWPLLLQAGGFAQVSGQKLQLSKAGRKALAEPAAHALKNLWDKWLRTTLLDELSRVECIKGQTGKGKSSLVAVAWRRDAIVEGLAACPVGRWVTPAELQRFLGASDVDFLVSRNPWHLYVCEPQYGALGYDGYSHVLEERYLRAFLFEYAATLGLIDVAFIPPAGAFPNYSGMWGTDELPFFSRYDGLMFFRVTALGAYCLGSAGDYAPPPLEKKVVLRVLPNLEIAAMGEDFDAGDCLALDAYAVRVSDRLWRLERSRLLAASEEGRSIQEIEEFLTARSAGPLPAPVAELLTETRERCSRVRDQGLARLFECQDEALAALIASDTRTRRHCMRAGERHVAVPGESEAAFRRGLRELGYLPADATTRVKSRKAGRTEEPELISEAQA
jgi:hypothetical protein